MFPSGNGQVQFDTPIQNRFTAYFTGKNIHSTAATRTAWNGSDGLQVGDVLIPDPYGHDKGVGVDFAVPIFAEANTVANPFWSASTANAAYTFPFAVVTKLLRNVDGRPTGEVLSVAEGSLAAGKVRPGYVELATGFVNASVLNGDSDSSHVDIIPGNLLRPAPASLHADIANITITGTSSKFACCLARVFETAVNADATPDITEALGMLRGAGYRAVALEAYAAAATPARALKKVFLG